MGGLQRLALALIRPGLFSRPIASSARPRGDRATTSDSLLARDHDSCAMIGSTQAQDAVTGLGHRVQIIDVGCTVPELVRRLTSFKPDMVFNMAEGSRGRSREAFYPRCSSSLGSPTRAPAHTRAWSPSTRS